MMFIETSADLVVIDCCMNQEEGIEYEVFPVTPLDSSKEREKIALLNVNNVRRELLGNRSLGLWI